MPSRLKELLSRPSRRSSHQEHPPPPSANYEPSTPPPSDSPSPRPATYLSGNDDDFAAMWRDALDDFWCLTGEDVCDENSTLYRCLKGCSDYAGVVKILEDHALAFKAYRQGSHNALKMRAALRPVVRAVLTVIDVGAEAAASKAVPGGKAIFVALAVLLRTVQGMSARFDALVVLLEKFGSFLERLDIRVNAPLEPVSRSLIVKTLVEMLRTLAYATRMMRQNRAKHFFTVLIGQGGGLTELTNRTENLMIEETRLSLAEVHSRMHDLSDAFMTTLKQIEDDITHLSKRMDALSMDVDGVSEQLRVSGVYNMPQQFHAFMERYEENRVNDGSDRVLELSMTSLRNDISVQTALITSHVSESEMRLQRNLRQDLLDWPRTSFAPHSNWVSQVSLPCVDMVSFARMAAEVMSCFQGLSLEEQAILKEGIVTLFSAAATSVSMGSSDRTVVLAGVLYPGAVLSGFLPMAFVFLAIFAFWRRFVCRTQSEVPRAPGHAFEGSIILIDVFGTHYILRPDMCKNWEDLHDFLLDQYEGKSAVEFIRSHAYRITDSNRHGSFVRRQDWNSVRIGSTLELSFAVRQTSLMCPWCGVHAVVCESERIQCHTCARHFWASNDSVGSTREPAKDITAELDSLRSSQNGYAEAARGLHSGIQSYRRVVVVYSDNIDSEYQTSGHDTRRSDLGVLTHALPHAERPSAFNERDTPSRHRGKRMRHDLSDPAGQSDVDIVPDHWQMAKFNTALAETNGNAHTQDIHGYVKGHTLKLPGNQPDYTTDVNIERLHSSADVSLHRNTDDHALINHHVALGFPLSNADTLRFLREWLAETFEVALFGFDIALKRALDFLFTAWSFSGVDSFDNFIYMAIDRHVSNPLKSLDRTFHHFDDNHIRLKSGSHYTPHPCMSIWDVVNIDIAGSPYCGHIIPNALPDSHKHIPRISWSYVSSWNDETWPSLYLTQIELNFNCHHGVPIAHDNHYDVLDVQSWTLPASLKLMVHFGGHKKWTYTMQLHTSHTASRVLASCLAKETSKNIRHYLLHPQPLDYRSEGPRGPNGRKIGTGVGDIFIPEISLIGVRFLSPDTVEPILFRRWFPNAGK